MPFSPSETRELLAALGHHPKRFLGQNFLVDGNIVRKSLQLAELSAGERVVEVGPGLGTLTGALLEAGAEVWAVERDATLCRHLAATLATRFPDRLHLLEGDAVEHPRAGLGEGDGEFKIVANLPYAISTPWMDAVLAEPLASRMVLMLQKESADRYCASPGTKSFGAISIFLQAAYDVKPGHVVSGACFHPRPEVDSKLLVLARKAAPFVFPDEARAFVRSCFQQRRKQIGSILAARPSESATRLLDVLRSAGHSEKSRAEQLPVELWVRFGSAFAGR